jgi:cell division protein FtsI/penicillin-binding protein 2
VAPGSTFKTVTAVGVLDNGSATADTVVDCPATLTVDGATFKNAHDEVLGKVALHTDFAQSCNTAFASLAPKLGPDGLAKTAANLGIGVPWDLGVDVYSGKVSSGGSKSEQAAAAFGQGTTTVSPVALAGAAAAIARGQWKQPHLMVDPAPAKPAADGPAIKPEVQNPMKTMMREVVTGGTATPLKGVKGDQVYGKTGTAEFATGNNATHSWFMGVRGDVAFAVFIESGGLSTEAAVPMTKRFLDALG